MKQSRLVTGLTIALTTFSVLTPGNCSAEQKEAESTAVSLPAGVKVVWDLGKAFRETTSTRERICLNGLWRWQPAQDLTSPVPAGQWGYFKVPGFWPGNTSYIQEDCQTLHVHPGWKDTDIRSITAAWYEREIT